MTGQVTAGTAGRNYKCDPDAHPFHATPSEPGMRPLCWCGSERAEHLPTARRTA